MSEKKIIKARWGEVAAKSSLPRIKNPQGMLVTQRRRRKKSNGLLKLGDGFKTRGGTHLAMTRGFRGELAKENS